MTTQTDTPGSVTAVYKVSGMSCGHCEGPSPASSPRSPVSVR